MLLSKLKLQYRNYDNSKITRVLNKIESVAEEFFIFFISTKYSTDPFIRITKLLEFQNRCRQNR